MSEVKVSAADRKAAQRICEYTTLAAFDKYIAEIIASEVRDEELAECVHAFESLYVRLSTADLKAICLDEAHFQRVVRAHLAAEKLLLERSR